MAAIASLRLFVALSIFQHAGGECINDIDCSLAGVCANGTCACSPAWTGPHCERLNLLPAVSRRTVASRSFPWGGAVAFDPSDRLYHLWFTEYANDCPMTYGTWTTQTHIRHAVSRSPAGPFVPKEVAVPAAAGNPVIARAPDGTWLLFFTNQRYRGAQRNCTSGNSSEWSPPVYITAYTGINLAYSNHSGGPWRLKYNVVDRALMYKTNPGV